MYSVNQASISHFHNSSSFLSLRKKETTNTKLLRQRKAGFVQSELTLRGVGGSTVRLWVRYLFGRLLLFHTIPNYNIHYFPAKPLHYAFKATLFSCKKQINKGRKEGHKVRGVKVHKSFVYLAGRMLFILPIANHNICNVSAKAGDYTLKTALFAWRQTNGFHRFLTLCVDENTTQEEADWCASGIK